MLRLVDDGAGVRRRLGAPRHRVGLGAHDVVGTADLELVDVAGTHAGDEELPHARGADDPHGVDPAVPVVEVADDAHRLRSGCPYGEGHAAHRTHGSHVLADAGPENGPQLLVPTFADEVEVHLPEGRCEPVGVVLEVLDAVRPGDDQPVVHRPGGVGAHRRPHALRLVRELQLLAVLEAHADRAGQRLEHADAQPTGLQVLAEQVVRLLVASLDEGGDRAADLGARGGGHDGSPCMVVGSCVGFRG